MPPRVLALWGQNPAGAIIVECQEADFLPYSISDKTCGLIWEDPSDG